MRTGPNFIPTGTSKKEISLRQQILEESDRYLGTYIRYRKIMEQQGSIGKIKIDVPSPEIAFRSHEYQMLYKICTENQFSASTGNPSWYPPVPEYTPPKGKRLSAQEVGEGQVREAQIRYDTNESDFVKHDVVITPRPMQVSEFESAVQSIDKITGWGNLSSIGQDVEVITGFKESELCSIPITTSMVGFRINFILTGGEKKELAGVYVFEKPMIITNLVTKLDTLEVTNMHDLRATKDTLLQKLKELESKS